MYAEGCVASAGFLCPAFRKVSKPITSFLIFALDAYMGNKLRLAPLPVPTWRTVYNNGKTLAITMLLISTASGYYLDATLDDSRWLIGAILNTIVMPYTGRFMKPTNDALFALKYKPGDVTTEEKSLLSKWGTLQWVRTVLGLAAFGIGIHAVTIVI